MSQQPSQQDAGVFRWFTDTVKTVGSVAAADYLRREYPEQIVTADPRTVVVDPGYINQQRAAETRQRADALSSADLQRVLQSSQTRMLMLGGAGVLAGVLAYSVLTR